ncbi:protein inside capsid B [Escherichia phage vB_EcoP_PHB20]|uniref:Internal virion protein gp14 n=2 Tax=Teseptimavirus IME390 TaxID=2733870 RepID=A0A386KEU6_9CAUD|nr:internal virion protein [Enterobacteria phage vB_EcoP_IME390]AYD82953.1 protein inside capsid B [Enterobacteria phage vB_EcoP_IME390]QHI00819.1 protein inside capsid B [Escherichia phage vB_EcoP_PHB20]
MCWAAAIPIAIAGAQAVGSQNAQAKMIASQTAAGRRQAFELMKQTNIQNADLSLQARSRLEEASSELTPQNMQKVQAMGSIRAAIGESMLEGASMDRIKRVTEGQFIREANMVTENYRRDYQAIFAQQLGGTQSAASQIDEIYKGEQKQKSKLQMVLDPLAIMGSATASAYASGAFDSKSTNKAPIVAAKGTKTGR